MSEMDLSDTIRNTHAATLTQGDLDAWADEVEETEAERDQFEAQYMTATGELIEALGCIDTMRRKRDAWRFLSLLGFGIWILFVLAACSGSLL